MRAGVIHRQGASQKIFILKLCAKINEEINVHHCHYEMIKIQAVILPRPEEGIFLMASILSALAVITVLQVER